MVAQMRLSVTFYVRWLSCSVSPRHLHFTNAPCSFIHSLRCLDIIIIIIIIIIKWPCSPVYSFAFMNIGLYAAPSAVVWSSS